MAHRTAETYRRLRQRDEAVKQIPCGECGVPLWNHDERTAGHRFVNSVEPPPMPSAGPGGR